MGMGKFEISLRNEIRNEIRETSNTWCRAALMGVAIAKSEQPSLFVFALRIRWLLAMWTSDADMPWRCLIRCRICSLTAA